jgi:hypothetical protein
MMNPIIDELEKELPDIRKVPGLYGNDSSFGFQTEKSQRIFLEKYSAAEQSGLPKLLANNIDHVGPKSELALLAIYSHDYLLESALKYVETDHSGDPLNDDDFELGTNNYLKILYNIDQALKCESPIDEIHDLLLQDFDDLKEPTPEFLSLYEPLTAETGSYVVIDESETKDANSSAVIPENKVETTGAHNIISENEYDTCLTLLTELNKKIINISKFKSSKEDELRKAKRYRVVVKGDSAKTIVTALEDNGTIVKGDVDQQILKIIDAQVSY